MPIRRYKFRVGEKAIITADLGDVSKAPSPRRGLLDAIDPEYPGRRLNFPAITFYDCATLNGADLRILKTPTYTIDPLLTPDFTGAVYTVETFGTADFAAFHDLLFEVPIAEWKDNYRRLDYDPNPHVPGTSEPTHYPHSLAIISPVTAALQNVWESLPQEVQADISTEFGRASRTDHLSDIGLCWDTRGLEYRGLTDIKYTYGTTQNRRDWFSASLVNSNYKVTATNDSSAADVLGTLTISGNIDVYLIPLVGMFIAGSYKGPSVPININFDGTQGMEILGPWYQAFPRYAWYEYVDPYGDGAYPDLFEDYLSYQKARSGAQASQWFWDGATGVTDSIISPSDFRTGNLSWKCTIDNLEHPDLYVGEGNGTAATYTDHTTSAIFDSSDPILMAVMKIHGQFYYVWDVAGGALDEIDFVDINRYTLSVYPANDEAP
jgi:hypothetical protein